jgi:hypothetical protein
VLDHPSHEEENPEAALRANYGLGRKCIKGGQGRIQPRR